MSFFKELKRRKVIQVTLTYIVLAWLVMQVADVILNNVDAPRWVFHVILLLLGLGLLFAIFFSWVFEITPGGIKRDHEANHGHSKNKNLTTEDLKTEETPPDPKESIAVLPFPDMSAEQDQGHFCDGLTEELLNVFTSIPDLRVASRTSCFAFKGKDTDLPTVASKLRVAHILEGSVRKAGNRIRVTAQLIEVSTDSHLWSETYDRELDDIFAIQDDIAARILDALKLTLGSQSLPDPTTNNAKAYELFLRGRGYAMTKADQDNQRAIELFQKATEIDPVFLRAWSDMALAYSESALFHAGGAVARQKAIEASQRAMQILPDHPHSLLARGHAHYASYLFDKARQDFLEVIKLVPDQFDAYHHLARLEQHCGNIDLSIEYFRKAMELNPDDYESPLLAIGSYQSAGDENGMRHYARVGIERARQHLEDYPESPRPYYLGTTALLILDQPDEAQKWAEAALSISPDDSTTRYNIACFYSLAGQIEASLDLLETSILSRQWIENDPELEPLREHPRYKALIDSLPK